MCTSRDDGNLATFEGFEKEGSNNNNNNNIIAQLVRLPEKTTRT